MIITLYMLRAFVANDTPESGGRCGVIFDLTRTISEAQRQEIASHIHLPEIVYINSVENAEVQVFTPIRQLSSAGYPLIATAWLLHRQGYSIQAMTPPAGRVSLRVNEEGAWLALPLTWLRPYEFQEVRDISSLREERSRGETYPPDASSCVVRWAWSDRVRRHVVTSFTAPDHPLGQGISASIALRLGGEIGPPLVVEQGNSSVCSVVCGKDGALEVGGHVVLDRVEQIDYEELI